MTAKQRNQLIRIITALILLIVLHFLDLDRLVMFPLYLIPYLIVGGDILKKAWKGIVNRQPLDENLLMAVATLGAMALAVFRTGDYTEAVAVMIFYQIGEFFQSYAVGRSRRNIGELMDVRPDYANVEGPDGVQRVDPDEVEIGSLILVQPGEKVPIDGVIEEGQSSLDTSALTGESVPRSAGPGDEVLSGCINTSGVLRIRTTCEFEESTASKILDLVENASSRKARSERFISRFARVYTPVVVFSALALAVIPPLIQLAVSGQAAWGDWVYRALTFLVISCPCALVISVPLSFFSGIGGASRQGILIKGANFLETLAGVSTVVMDKTGTLTKGVFAVTRVETADDSEKGMTGEELLAMAAAAEKHSSHPIAAALRNAAQNTDETYPVSDVEEIAGHGIRARVEEHIVCVGNRKLMAEQGALADGAGTDSPAGIKGGPAASEKATAAGAETVVHVAVDGRYAGSIHIADQLKDTSAEAVEEMRKSGIRRLVMLTGDGRASAEAVAAQLGIDQVYAELLPGDKVARVEELMGAGSQGNEGAGNQGNEDAGGAVRNGLAFVGDGINDAPVLSRADVGIAMGALGSDAAIEAGDVVLMDDDPRKIAVSVRIARKCMRIVKENIWFAIGIKVLCLVLCALGLVGMWAAIFADVGVMVLAVLNAMRALSRR